RYFGQRRPVMNHMHAFRVNTPPVQNSSEVCRDHNNRIAATGRFLVQPDEILAYEVTNAWQLLSQQPIRGQAVNILDPRYQPHPLLVTPTGQPNLRNRRRIGGKHNPGPKPFTLLN